jgi:hypothetical protein
VKVIFQTPPMPCTSLGQTGQEQKGTAFFQAILYEPGEPTRVGLDGEPSRTLAFWRTSPRFTAGDVILISPARIRGVPDAAIPRAVVDSLPDDARLDLVWRFTADRPKP